MSGNLGCYMHDPDCRYRTADEMNRWRARDPVMRFQSLLLANDWWDPQQEKDLRLSLRKEVCFVVK
jgi:TPP-dependent pyruvate/acetoin dehydrogenase alpha subunit